MIDFFVAYLNWFFLYPQYLDDDLDSIDDVEKYEKAHNFKVGFLFLLTYI
jgi:hypothetical protein